MIARTHPPLALATAFVLAGCTGSADAPSYTFGMVGATPEAAYTTGPVHAFHIPMRDGVRIALDLVLPEGLADGARIPAVMTMTRYWRSREGAGPTGLQALFTRHGYAVISGDSRGTGASFGTWVHPRQRAEVLDFGEVIDWIVEQPWSDGTVGAIGTSYAANTADWTAFTARRALKAIIPRFPDFDPYTDLYFPGGIFHLAFGKNWSESVRSQDMNEKRMGPDGVTRGVRPVDDDPDGSSLLAAIKERAPLPGYYDGLVQVVYRDDQPDIWYGTFDDFGIHTQRDVVERTGLAIYTWGGWMDAGTAAGVLKRFKTWRNPQLAVVGPWSHGGRHHASPYLPTETPTDPNSETQSLETVRFFNWYLRGIDTGIPERLLLYYTMGEEVWKSTPTWPPVGSNPVRWYLAPAGSLGDDPPDAEAGADAYTVDYEATTGTANRWYTQRGGGDVVYPDRASADKGLLTYSSGPLDRDVEITGFPTVTLYVSSTATDGAFFAYLEEVDPSGGVTYLTEGQIRALHRRISDAEPQYDVPVPRHSFERADGAPLVPGEITRLSFGLLPTSVVVRRGHRLRLAIAGADKDTFARIPASGPPPVVTVQRNRQYSSHIDLPIVERRASP